MDELVFYQRVALAGLGADLPAVLETALEAARELTRADRGAVVVVGPHGFQLTAHSGDEAHPGLSHTILRQVVDEARTIRLENALDTPELAQQASVQNLQLLSVLAVPLRAGERGSGVVVGALYLDSIRASGIFTAEQQQVIERFAEHLAPQVARAREALELRRRVEELEAALAGAGEAAILGASPLVLELRHAIGRVAPSDVPVLVTGESGTGKELVARALHTASPRAQGPLITVNCGALPGELLQSELFGHVAGAFSGARGAREGKFAAADGGTIFLDEIGELPLPAQAALLRVLEDGELQVVGSDRPRTISARVVAATNRDLLAETKAGTFREDLYYRLSVVQLEVPPLRKRGDDVLFLAEHFLQRFALAEGRARPRLAERTRRLLRDHPWPGNVRELRNVVRRAVLFADDEVTPAHLPASLQTPSPSEPAPDLPTSKEGLDRLKQRTLEELEEQFVLAALERTQGNVAQAARATGLHRSVVHRILKRIREA